jgi:hypothetical protein
VGNEWREGEGVWNVGLGFGVHVLFVRDSLLGWLKGQRRIEPSRIITSMMIL